MDSVFFYAKTLGHAINGKPTLNENCGEITIVQIYMSKEDKQMKMEAMRNAVEANVVAEGKASNIFDFNKTAREAADLFNELCYNFGGRSENGIATKLFPMWWEAKKGLRNLLRNNANWDERQQAIIYDSSYKTGVDIETAKQACYWFRNAINDKLYERKVDFDENRYIYVKSRYSKAIDVLCILREFLNDDLYEAAVRQKYEYEEEFNRLSVERGKLKKKIHNDEYYFVTEEDAIKYRSVIDFFDYYNYRSDIADEDFANYVNNLGDFKAVAGQKVSKIVNKICKAYGIDKIKEMREVVRHAGSDHETREMKDYGYNHQFAKFADAVNTLNITKYTVISINPMDYWTMSFFKDTASCHTIDKLNVRGVGDDDHVYGGMYSAGTESYMLDNVSVVFYTVDANYKGDMWKAPKDRRMMFHIGEDFKHFIFGRLYPDGRDGGDTGLGAQFRNVIQKVLSECAGLNNLWKVAKGVSNCDRYSISYGRHYADYSNYDDCGICYLTDTEMRTIEIGHEPVCPYCGKEHTNKENVFCREHNGMTGRYSRCYRCNNRIDTESENYIHCEDNDRDYCCADCAYDDGLELCVDDEEWHDNWMRDSYTEDCYSMSYYEDSLDAISSWTGNMWFSSHDTMEDAGYVEVNGYAYREDVCFFDDYDDEWYLESDYDYISIDGYHFKNEENAIAYGFVQDEDGEWTRA